MTQAQVSHHGAARTERWRDLLLFALLLLTALGGTVAVHGGLDFPIVKDEIWFWSQTTQWFLERWPPDLADLRNYPEPMTPLSFLVWASVERMLGLGIAGARATNLLLSACLLALVGLRLRPPTRPALLCALGLLLFPYTLPLSLYVYTDVLGALLVVLGFWLYARQRPVLSSLAFALAIANRQYMVAFPAALLAAELAPELLPRRVAGRWRLPPGGADGRVDWKLERTLPLALAMLSLLGWFAFFGGFGPPAGVADWPRHDPSLSALEPGFALYFLTCMGVYFVGVELVLFRRWDFLRALRGGRALAAFPVVLLLYALLSPIDPEHQMGPLNRTMLLLLPPETLGVASEAVRVVLYAVLAWVTCVRVARGFSAGSLVFWILLANGTLMLASFEAWEKYNLATLAALWYLRSLSDLDHPWDLWTARRPEAASRGAVGDARPGPDDA